MNYDIDYANVLTIDAVERLSIDKIDFIRVVLDNYPIFIEKKFGISIDSKNTKLPAIILEFVLERFEKQPDSVKSLIAANLLYPTSKSGSIIKMLLEYNIKFEKLGKLLEKLEYHRITSRAEKRLSMEEIHIDYDISFLCEIMEKHFYHNDYNLILAKLVSIFTLERHLYLAIETQYFEDERTR